MSFDIGIIGAMDSEVNGLVARLENAKSEAVGGIKFYTGELFSKKVVIARCGVGKVFAAMCAEAMIIKYSPRLIVNSGVAGALSPSLKTLDIVIGERVCQHDMDTSPLGDPVGFISGIEKIYFDADMRAVEILEAAASRLGYPTVRGVIASGDRFVADNESRKRITSLFSASACEMEGGAIAQAAYLSDVPFIVIRAISDGANDDSAMDFPTFLGKAASRSELLTLELVREF
ncbi:MAG: 5'-methylthioadenosine/adenosylhomocysteine nucleosidase [Clostridia bacterium]|nr:5'-methylthioadenosine/adenosylhomocysteine nucleosidase [Clostridia bacterium]